MIASIRRNQALPFRHLAKRPAATLGALLFLLPLPTLPAADLETIGVSLLRNLDATLQGSGVKVTQVEAAAGAGSPVPFEVSPNSVGQPSLAFKYLSSLGATNIFPNSVGAESAHANGVASHFYGVTEGVAPQVALVENVEAEHFYNSIIAAASSTAMTGRIVNQSFVFGALTDAQRLAVEQNYDNYAIDHQTLFVSGVGNDGTVTAPATTYNGIGVGSIGGQTSIGPTSDGRCKPDLCAPGTATSFSTPYVSGAAAVLLQAALRGDGGSDTNAAADLRTLKALLLNGAVKPTGWTNGASTPLDARYGAGVVHIANAWNQLRSGRRTWQETTANAAGGAHPPGTNPNNMAALAGWDFSSVTNVRSGPSYQEQVNHYYFNLPSSAGRAYTLTATLAWHRQRARTSINDLNLFLFNASTGSAIAASNGTSNNVEHLYLEGLPPGRYDLQVLKNPAKQVTPSETYALAFEFSNPVLTIASAGTQALLTWPIFPAGLELQAADDPSASAAWQRVSNSGLLIDALQVLAVPSTGNRQFYRLVRP